MARTPIPYSMDVRSVGDRVEVTLRFGHYNVIVVATVAEAQAWSVALLREAAVATGNSFLSKVSKKLGGGGP